jgi:CheY-like chemotaxis protein
MGKKTDIKDLKILVAEDSGLSFVLTQALIERLTGVNPDRAVDGQQAVNMAENGSYDLIIMDQMMPKLSGIEATRMIREALPEWKQPFIAGLSGATTPVDLVNYEAAGMDRFLAKPMRLHQLKELIELVAETGRGEAAFEAMDSLEVSLA